MRALMREVFSAAKRSGMASAGTRPYFVTTSCTPQKVPPSESGFLKSHSTVLSSMGRSAWSMVACRKRLAFSSWS